MGELLGRSTVADISILNFNYIW